MGRPTLYIVIPEDSYETTKAFMEKSRAEYAKKEVKGGATIIEAEFNGAHKWIKPEIVKVYQNMSDKEFKEKVEKENI